MEEEKKKQIEAKLRRLIALGNTPEEQPRSTLTKSGTRVIRRRKGSPDLQIA